MTQHKTSKAGDGATTDRLPGSEITDKIDEQDLSEFSQRVILGATANDAKRIRTAQQEDDLIDAQMNRSFNDILRSLPIDDFDRESLELDRGYLAKRCERARRVVAFTGALSDLRKYARLKAKIAVIDLLLSSEMARLIEASLRQKVS
jgi:hypothetical protein